MDSIIKTTDTGMQKNCVDRSIDSTAKSRTSSLSSISLIIQQIKDQVVGFSPSDKQPVNQGEKGEQQKKERGSSFAGSETSQQKIFSSEASSRKGSINSRTAQGLTDLHKDSVGGPEDAPSFQSPISEPYSLNSASSQSYMTRENSISSAYPNDYCSGSGMRPNAGPYYYGEYDQRSLSSGYPSQYDMGTYPPEYQRAPPMSSRYNPPYYDYEDDSSYYSESSMGSSSLPLRMRLQAGNLSKSKFPPMPSNPNGIIGDGRSTSRGKSPLGMFVEVPLISRSPHCSRGLV